MNNKKVFVLDTNVIMNDAHSIFKFGDENDVIIPLVVLKELDNHKSGNRPINYQVRQFHALLDAMSSNKDSSQKLFNGGVDLIREGKKTGGRIAVKFFDQHPDVIKKLSDKNDYAIINVAYCLQKEGKIVELISEDLNVRLIARTLDITAGGSRFNSASDENLNYKGLREITDNQVLNELFKSGSKTVVSKRLVTDLLPTRNEYFFSENELFSYIGDNKFEKRTIFKNAFGIKPRNIEQRVLLDLLLDDTISIITAAGPAGTGKTLLGLAAGFEKIGKRVFENILVSRREIGADQEEQGFLPGDSNAKSAPFMAPFIDNLKVIKHSRPNNDKSLEKIKEENPYPFEILSIMYLRGRTLSNSFIIIDEAQNLTPSLVKTIITRAGDGTKILFCGDLDQVDDKYLRKNLNGLSYLMENLKDQPIYAHIALEEVERSPLAKLGTMLP
jgi:PhoH-like ATPase